MPLGKFLGAFVQGADYGRPILSLYFRCTHAEALPDYKRSIQVKDGYKKNCTPSNKSLTYMCHMQQ